MSSLRHTLATDRVVGVGRSSGDINVDIASPEGLALRPGDVVIDAVGPFRHDPRRIVAHCLTNGAHYVDISESTAFHESATIALHDHEEQQTATSALVQGCSTIPAMVDVLMPSIDGKTRTVLLSVGSRNKASASLLYGLIRPLGCKHGSGRWWYDRVARRLLDGRRRLYGSHPSPFLDGRTEFYCGLDRRFAYWVLRVLAPVTHRLSDAALFALCRIAMPVASGVAAAGTYRGSLRIERTDGAEPDELVEIRAERHGLMIPALPAVWAALALLERNDVAGQTHLSELVDRSGVLMELRERGYVVDVVSAGQRAC